MRLEGVAEEKSQVEVSGVWEYECCLSLIPTNDKAAQESGLIIAAIT
jgi:hypothetical protein